ILIYYAYYIHFLFFFFLCSTALQYFISFPTRRSSDLDLKVDSDIEVLNPDQYICSIADGGHLHMNVAIKTGRGYVPASENKTDDMPIGVIPVDSLFSPIKKVNYQVESARVGKRDDYDKLTLEI